MQCGQVMQMMVLVMVGVQTWNAVHASVRNPDDRFMDWLRSHSNNENAIFEYNQRFKPQHDSYDRKAIVAELLPEILRQLEQFRDTASVSENKRSYSKRNFWQPMGGPLPVETRLVSFGARLEPGESGAGAGASNKAMRYGRR